MKTINLIIILGFQIAFVGCNNDGNPGKDDSILQTISIDPQNEEKKTFSQIVDTICFIPLETTPDVLIGRISEMRIFNSKIYIRDGFGNCLFVFDISGVFLFKISQTGKGPEEFTKLSSFCVTEKAEIVVTDFSGKKVLFYNKEGVFINEVHTEFFPKDIASLGEDVFAITSYKPSKRIIIMNGNGEIIKRAFDEYPGFHRSYNNQLVTGSGKVFFREVYEDTIFHISTDIIAPIYFIDFQEKRMLKSYYMSLPLTEKRGLSTRIIPPGYRYNSHGMAETSKHFSFVFLESPARGNQFWCIYDKQKGKSSYMKVGIKFDDLLGVKFSPMIKTAYNDKFYYSIESYTFLEEIEITIQRFEKLKPGYLSQLEAVRDRVSIESNPILVCFSIIN